MQAFRHLSHKFHGRGSGKKKTERRLKKLQEEHVSKYSELHNIIIIQFEVKIIRFLETNDCVIFVSSIYDIVQFMNKSNSVDTPLNTLAMLQSKQQKSQTPYIFISGGSQSMLA